jgi:hypothetical protein
MEGLFVLFEKAFWSKTLPDRLRALNLLPTALFLNRVQVVTLNGVGM